MMAAVDDLPLDPDRWSVYGRRDAAPSRAASEYRLVTRWRVEGTVEEIVAILRDCDSWSRWWPAAFLEMVEIDPKTPGDVGRTAHAHVKGWMPHTLRFRVRVLECTLPHACIFGVAGDFEGRAVCRLERRGEAVELNLDWQVRVHKRFVRLLSWPLKWIFISNHRWVMRRGHRSLVLELKRRAASRSGEPASVPAPPGPTFPFGNRYRRVRTLAAWLGRAAIGGPAAGQRSPSAG